MLRKPKMKYTWWKILYTSYNWFESYRMYFQICKTHNRKLIYLAIKVRYNKCRELFHFYGPLELSGNVPFSLEPSFVRKIKLHSDKWNSTIFYIIIFTSNITNYNVSISLKQLYFQHQNVWLSIYLLLNVN